MLHARNYNLWQIVSRINGPIWPTGDQDMDDEIYKNMEQLIQMIMAQLDQIENIANSYHMDGRESIRAIAKQAENAIRDLKNYSVDL